MKPATLSRRGFLRSLGVTSTTVLMSGLVVPKLWVPDQHQRFILNSQLLMAGSGRQSEKIDLAVRWRFLTAQDGTIIRAYAYAYAYPST